MSATIDGMTNATELQSATSPREVWELLRAGNERFATGNTVAPNRDSETLQQLTSGQNPAVCVIGCSDSRVPVELLFDAGFGDIFVIRTAGGCVDSAVSASVEFAVDGLGVDLVLFLSHEKCGAVGSAVQAFESGEIPHGLTRLFVEKIAPSIVEAEKRGEQVEQAHARHGAEHIVARIPAVVAGLEARRIGVVGARYRLSDGRVETTYENFGD